jgi:hypothetical protein
MPITDLPLELMDIISKIIDMDTFEKIAISMRKKAPNGLLYNFIHDYNIPRVKNYWKTKGFFNLINEDDFSGIKYLSHIFIKCGIINNISCYLVYASKIGKFDTVKYFISIGINTEMDICYSVQNACENGHFNIVQHLINNFPLLFPFIITMNVNFCIRSACRNGHLAIVKYLIHLGANFRAVKDYPIRYARKNGHLRVVKYLEDTYNSFLLGEHLKSINFSIKSCNECNERDAVNKCKECKVDLCHGCTTINGTCDLCENFGLFS